MYCERVKIYAVCAGVASLTALLKARFPHVLFSYLYLSKDRRLYEMTVENCAAFDSIMVDSGAFTFFERGISPQFSFDEFVKKYAEFITKNTWIDRYVELDLDLMGIPLKKIEEWQDYLTQKTGRKPILVWHRCRGVEYWKKMCSEYEWVGFSLDKGTTIEEARKMVLYALKQGCKVHGFGITGEKALFKIPFSTVDSSSWMSGGRWGTVYLTKSQQNVRFVEYKKAFVYGALQLKRLQEKVNSYWRCLDDLGV